MPRLTQKTVTALINAGQGMSNLCYNLCQNSKQEHADTMRKAYLDWDAVMDVYRHEVTRTKSPKVKL